MDASCAAAFCYILFISKVFSMLTQPAQIDGSVQQKRRKVKIVHRIPDASEPRADDPPQTTECGEISRNSSSTEEPVIVRVKRTLAMRDDIEELELEYEPNGLNLKRRKLLSRNEVLVRAFN